MKAVAIVGGGIAGLSAAFELEKARSAGGQVTYTIFEASSRAGGALHTAHKDEFAIELGADSFLSEKPWAFELCRELSIEDQLIGSNDAGRQTWILFSGKLHPLPPGLQFIVPTTPESSQSGLFSEATRQQIIREKQLAPRQNTGDESVASFVERHFGKEFVERIAGPMLAGIYGGDCEKLSAAAVMPRFVEMEQTHGSLQLALAVAKKSAAPKKPIFTSFRDGMESLAKTITQKLVPTGLHVGSKVAGLQIENGAWKLHANSAENRFDTVIVAAPAFVAAELLSAQGGKLAEQLSAIRYASSATVALAYDARAVRFPAGFGILVPRSERRQMIACTFVHNKFPGRAPQGKCLVRVFFGGAHNQQALELPDGDLTSLARKELAEIFGATAQPEFAMVARWPRSMPQYEVGHLERVKKIRALVTQMPNLALCGSAYEGVGIPDCIRSGREAAKQVLARLQLHG